MTHQYADMAHIYTEDCIDCVMGIFMYGLILTVYVLAACLFIGTVFFEVCIMAMVRKNLRDYDFAPLEKALNQRLFAIMPWVLLTFVGSGLGLLHTHYRALLSFPDSSFAVLLVCKLILVASVLTHFGFIKFWRSRHVLTVRRSQLIHKSVWAHVLCIAILAKAMFYWTW